MSAGVTHGGLLAAELAALGLQPHDVLDFSVSVNPYGPGEAIRRAIASAPVDQYPDIEMRQARLSLARACDVDPDDIILGNGATELLWLAVVALAVRGPAAGRVIISQPAFEEVAAACAAHGVPVMAVPARRARGLAHDFEALAARATGEPTSLVYLCNPSTPDGAVTDHAALAAFAASVQPIPVLLDESFLSLSDGHAQASKALPTNVIRVRSLTKELGIPGVRVGFALAPNGQAQHLRRMQPSWSVGAAGQAVARVAPEAELHVVTSRSRIQASRAQMVAALQTLGLVPFASAAPYLAFPCPRACDLRDRLLRGHHILIRDCRSFGLPGVFRVAVRSEADVRRLVAALRVELGR